jgi:peptidoglycan hydrolase CwlO-like protein
MKRRYVLIIILVVIFIIGNFTGSKIPLFKNSERKKIENENKELLKKNEKLRNDIRVLMDENDYTIKEIMSLKKEVDSLEVLSIENKIKLENVDSKYKKINSINNFSERDLLEFFSEFRF